jgi:hypothetical protein
MLIISILLQYIIGCKANFIKACGGKSPLSLNTRLVFPKKKRRKPVKAGRQRLTAPAAHGKITTVVFLINMKEF